MLLKKRLFVRANSKHKKRKEKKPKTSKNQLVFFWCFFNQSKM